MDFGSINWLAVLVCVLASMVIGFVWYSPKAFFPAWWKGIGRTGEPGMSDYGSMGMGLTWGLTILSALVEAVFVAVLLNALGANTLAAGVSTAFILWLGLVATTNLVNKLFAGWSLKVLAIEAGNHLVTLLAYGAILGAWQ